TDAAGHLGRLAPRTRGEAHQRRAAPTHGARGRAAPLERQQMPRPRDGPRTLFRHGADPAGAGGPDLPLEDFLTELRLMPWPSPTSTAATDYDFIIVGSGAGGAPLAANLARKRYRVLLL